MKRYAQKSKHREGKDGQLSKGNNDCGQSQGGGYQIRLVQVKGKEITIVGKAIDEDTLGQIRLISKEIVNVDIVNGEIILGQIGIEKEITIVVQVN